MTCTIRPVCRPAAVRSRLALAAAAAAIIWISALSGPAGAAPAGLCAPAIDAAEAASAIPDKLLHAIALAESGRWIAGSKATIAWPWTVTSGADGRFFETRAAAIAHVRALQARGVRNIDVGCMQINLMHHPDAFDSLERAFDPAANAAYAADLLTRLNAAHKSWAQAVKHYHSATRALNRPYHDKVVRLWNAARRDAAGERSAAAIAAYEERQAEWRARREAAEAKRQAVIADWRAQRMARALGEVETR